MALNIPVKQLDKMSHIESFVTDDKTITEYKPHLLAKKHYVVCSLKHNKKTGDYYEPIFQSVSLDSSIFVYNNIHILDIMNKSKRKTLLKLNSNNSDNLEKVMLLDADLNEQLNKRLTVAKAKELKVNVFKQESDELHGF